jgi:4-hydroxybenzoate polyprenyltransferase
LAEAPEVRTAGAPGSAETSATQGGKATSRLLAIGDAVMIRHTLFSLPFAASALLLEAGGLPPLGKTALILLAAASARNAANALNRIVDRAIDAANPRTAHRHLPSGALRVRDLGWFSAVMLLVFVLATAALGPLCIALLPLAGILIAGYSYTKRFTWLCHAWLGVTCSAATMGAFIALTGHIELRFFVLTASVAAWVCGFDIIYALQDIEHDRAHGLHSIPARFGKKGARALAALCHAGTLAGFALLPLFWPRLGAVYYITIALCAILLAAEHLISLGGSGRHIHIAAYSINEVLPLLYFAGIATGTFLM